MNTAINPISGEVEDCTRTEPPFFEGDPVTIITSVSNRQPANIDTVDVDGDDAFCRVRFPGLSGTYIYPVERLLPR